MRRIRRKKEKKFLDTILIAVALFDLAFVIVMIVLFCLFQSVPDTLIVAVFGATFGECGCCAYVFRQKVKAKSDPYADEDE